MSRLVLVALFLGLVFASDTVRLVQTARDTGDRLSTKPSMRWSQDKAMPVTLSVDTSKTFQRIIGFGGAFTEAAAHNLKLMSTAKQEEIMNAYFGPTGNYYSIGRIPMNSCDFSIASYSFDDTVGDLALKNFDISHDLAEMIPMVQRAINMSIADLRLFLSPWSPPAWMKRNGEMVHSYTPGLIQDPKIFQSWALYFSKFITAYARHDITFWGLTVQNEPGFADGCPWEACGYRSEDERDFVRDYLGPQLQKDHPEVQIMIFDHNKDEIVNFTRVVYADSKAARFVAGTAFHWYSGDEFDHLDQVHALKPDKFMLATEACLCPPGLGDWSRGEAYAHDIIGDLNHWAAGWVDWNMILDMEGGPNHVKNFCGAPIHVDPSTDTIHYEAPYYYMGHITRYVLPDSIRVGLTLTGDSKLEATAFVVNGIQTVVVVMNPSDEPISFKLTDPLFAPGQAVYPTIPAHGIQTVTYAMRCTTCN